jgi:hypothetical protein
VLEQLDAVADVVCDAFDDRADRVAAAVRGAEPVQRGGERRVLVGGRGALEERQEEHAVGARRRCSRFGEEPLEGLVRRPPGAAEVSREPLEAEAAAHHQSEADDPIRDRVPHLPDAVVAAGVTSLAMVTT